MSTVPRPIHTKKTRKLTAKSTADTLSRMMEETLAKLPDQERERKRKRLMDLLDGKR
jgi:hypothetical protein